MIRNIIFDMGQVLIYFTPEKYVERAGFTGAEKEILLNEIFRKIEWVQLDHGTISEEDAIKSICKRLPEKYHDAVAELVSHWWERDIEPIPGMEEVMKSLKESGYKIYLLSNAGLSQAKYHHRLPGAQYFDGRLVSAEVKLLKPQYSIYEKLMDTYGLKAEESVFIDDAPANIEAAIFLGIHGILFDGKAQTLKNELKNLGVEIQ